MLANGGWDLIQRLNVKNHGEGRSSNYIMFMFNIVKIGQIVQKLKGEETHKHINTQTQTHTHTHIQKR